MNLFKNLFKRNTHNLKDDNFFNRKKVHLRWHIRNSRKVHKILLKEKNWKQMLFANNSLAISLLGLYMLEKRCNLDLKSRKEYENKEYILDKIFDITNKIEVPIADIYYLLNLWVIHEKFDKINRLIKIVHLIKPPRYSEQNLFERQHMNFLNFLCGNTEKINYDFIQKSHKSPIIKYYSLFPELYSGILNKTDVENNIVTIKDEYKTLQKKLFKDSSPLYGGYKDTEVVTNFTLEVALKISSNIDKLKTE